MARFCSVEGCLRRHMARGYCTTHYGRWAQTGSTDPRVPKHSPLPPPADISPTDLAWAAGFFEGEGTVRIEPFTTRRLGALTASVVNTDRECVEWFQQRWPGRMRPATGMRPDQRPAWVWVRYSTNAAAFLRDIEPHLQSNRVRRKVRLALDYQAQKILGGHQGDEYRREQERYFLAMKALNRRGVLR